MATLKFVQAQPFKLAGSGSSIGDTTLTLQSMVGIDGSLITTTDIGIFGEGTIEPGNGVQEEAIQFTGITQNSNGTATLTGVSTVLFKSPYTATSGIAKTHAGATTFILTNSAAFYGQILAYVDGAVSSGGIPATNLVQGISRLSVAAASASNPIVVGDNDTRIPTASQASVLTNLSSPGMVLKNTLSTSTTVPTGFLKTDGSAVSRTGATAALFAAIGTTYGTGNGSTTFNLPESYSSFGGAVLDFTNSQSNTGSVTSITMSHTVSSSSGVLIVAFAGNSTAGSVQYGGVSMTSMSTPTTGVNWFYMLNPSVGTANITASFSSAIMNVVSMSFVTSSSLTFGSEAHSNGSSVTTLTESIAATFPSLVVAFFASTDTTSNISAPGINIRSRVSAASPTQNIILGDVSVNSTAATVTVPSSAIAGGIAYFTYGQGGAIVTRPDMIKT